MSIRVVMPQMGESVTEGTIIKWLVAEGGAVAKDDPLFEVSTDKVDAEIPAPASGVVAKILVSEGETVLVGAVVAEMTGEGEEAPQDEKPAPAAEAASEPPRETERPVMPPPVASPAGESAAVTLPQMGESVAEGTIIKWLVAVGDEVAKDDPLFEISTDKVDAEIPSPVTGVVREILVPEGETVEVGRVVALVGDGPPAPASSPSVEASPAPLAPHVRRAAGPSSRSAGPIRSSPVARRIAREHGIDITALSGTGRGGRVSKKDVLGEIEKGAASGSPEPRAPSPAAPPSAMREGETESRPMTVMRRKIAEHMVRSKRTSPHVLTVFEVDVTAAEKIRAAHKAEFEQRHGARLTLTVMAIHAVTSALREFPIVNASVDGESIVFHKSVHIGVAVALEEGLIVPVIRSAERMGIGEIARSLQDLGTRARAKGLTPDEVRGATFTITNPGPYGALFNFPIINQPNVAILGMGGAKKRPVVVDDAIAIRNVAFFSLSFDHRVIDGAVADRFMARFRERFEAFPEEIVR